MTKFVSMLFIVSAVLAFGFASLAEAKGFGSRGGSFGRSSYSYRIKPSYKSPSRPTTNWGLGSSSRPTSVPSVAPSAPSVSSAKPTLKSLNWKVTPKSTSYKVDGGRNKSEFAGNYRQMGYTPTQQQSSWFNSSWFWMYMISGHSNNSVNVAPIAPKQMGVVEFEQNCRNAVAQADKPVDLDVKADDCEALADLAYRKVQAEAISYKSPSVIASDKIIVGTQTQTFVKENGLWVKPEPKVKSESSSHSMALWLCVLAALGFAGGLVLMRRAS